MPHTHKQAQINTAELILQSSLELFNTVGVESTSIGNIAKKINISTGNLTYHFKRKRDIVCGHLELLQNNITQTLESFPFTGNVKDFVTAYAGMFKILWDHRYLVNSSTYLIHNQLLTIEEYSDILAHLNTTLVAQCEQLRERGYMEPIAPPYSIETLVDCIWWQWAGWLGVNEIHYPKEQQTPVNKIIVNGIRHSVFITQPYLRRPLLNKIYNELDKLEQKNMD